RGIGLLGRRSRLTPILAPPLPLPRRTDGRTRRGRGLGLVLPVLALSVVRHPVVRVVLLPSDLGARGAGHRSRCRAARAAANVALARGLRSLACRLRGVVAGRLRGAPLTVSRVLLHLLRALPLRRLNGHLLRERGASDERDR